MERKTFFTVQGKPFYSLGIQTHNSSSSTPEYLQYSWNAAKKIEANTVAVPVSWELFEPREGAFREAFVTDIISQARENNLKLILLWFGTWKNGTMEYTPSWVKKDTERFPRAELKDGRKTHNLSPHCPENLEADRKAFCRLLEVVKRLDQEFHTVIGVQIENEAGMHSATRRDFSKFGDKAFKENVPERLITYCKENPSCYLAKEWLRQGEKSNGNWTEVFGAAGGEWVTTWAVAAYIDEIARAGKEIYDIFLYTNAWLNEGRGLAGVDWPSGTPRQNNLDIYYAVCTHLDNIAPDIYLQEVTGYLDVLKTYSHPEKGFPLYVPESSRSVFNSGMMFEGIGDYGSIGYHIFGGESLLTDDQKELNTEEGISMKHSFHMIRNVVPVLPEYTGTDRIHGIHRRGIEPSALIEGLLGGWRAYVSFEGTMDQFYRMDFLHKEACWEETLGNKGEPCRGLLLQESENVFYVVGHKFRIYFLQEEEADGSLSAVTVSGKNFSTNAEYLSVTEGHFDETGRYFPDVVRTGDETRHGTYAQWDSNVLRIELMKI